MDVELVKDNKARLLNFQKFLPLIVIGTVNAFLISAAIIFFVTSFCNVEDNIGSDVVKAADDVPPNYANSEIHSTNNSISGKLFGHLKPEYELFPEDDFVHDFECGVDKIKYNTRIVGGEEVIKGSWPWLVRLVMEGQAYMCGATLVSPVHTISAAHCLQERVRYEIIYDNFDAYHGERARVHKIRNHPAYDPIYMKYDHAIVTHEKIPFGDTVTPACLPLKPYPCDTTDMYVAGFGNLAEKKDPPRYLQQVKVPLVVPCNPIFSIQPVNICAGKEGLDSCQGDSGGPFGMHVKGKWYLFGIVSFGQGCARKGHPGYYARVDTLMNWFCCFLKDHKSCKNIVCNKKGFHSYPPTTPDNPQVFLPKEAPECADPSEWENPDSVSGGGGNTGGGTGTGGTGGTSTGGTDETGGTSTGETGGGGTGEAGGTSTGGTEETGGTSTGETGGGGTGETGGTSTGFSSHTNNLGICIGEPYQIHNGWNRDGTKKEGSSDEKIGSYYVNAESLMRSFSNDSEQKASKRSISCKCGQMNQAYFDFLKKTDILEYNNLWLSHIRGTATVNDAVCKLI